MMMMCRIRSDMFLFLLAAFPFGRVLSKKNWHFTGLNVARNKVTTQRPRTADEGVSQRAVDGRRDAYWSNGSCTYAARPYNASASWSVDLNGSYIIKGIRIYNRAFRRDRLAFFQIIGYPTEMTLHDDRLVRNKLFQELVINIHVNSTIAFSNITINIPARESWRYNEQYALTLCEVEVYADIKCKAPSSVTNGHYIRASNTDYSFGNSLVWKCSDGFKSDQNKTRQCISTSEWSGAEPNCLLITCAFPVNLSNVSLTFSNGSTYESGIVLSTSYIGVHCQEGFRTNVTSITCTLDGEWNTLPTCSQITCTILGFLLNDTLLTFENGSTYTETVPSTSAVSVHCQEGFRTNVTSITCTLDGEWSTLPTCSQITCDRPEVLLNGTLLTFANGSTYTAGTVPSTSSVSVHCQEGFRTNVTSITCTLDGEWNTLPTCSQITFTRLGFLLNGTYTYTYNYATMANHTEVKFVYGTIAEANCNDALTYKGELRVCREDGNWFGVEGTCESEKEIGPPLFPIAAVGVHIAGCISLAAVVAVISRVYFCRRRNGTRTEEGSNTAPSQCTTT